MSSPPTTKGARTPARSELPEQPGHLWLLALSPAVWALHFLACYVTAAVWCAKSGAVAAPGATPLGPARVAVAAYTVVALAVIAATAWHAWRRMRRLRPRSEGAEDRSHASSREEAAGRGGAEGRDAAGGPDAAGSRDDAGSRDAAGGPDAAGVRDDAESRDDTGGSAHVGSREGVDRRRAVGRLEFAGPHDADTPADRERFLALATLLLSGLSFVATVFTALAAVFIGDCR